jgi:hypothetical protein
VRGEESSGGRKKKRHGVERLEGGGENKWQKGRRELMED